MTKDRYSELSPFMQALDKATAPPEEGAPIDYLIGAGMPGAGTLSNAARTIGRDVSPYAKALMNQLGFGQARAKEEAIQNPGEGIHDPHTGNLIPTLKAFPGKVPHFDPQTGKTTLINDTPLPEASHSLWDTLSNYLGPEESPVDYGSNTSEIPKTPKDGPSPAAIGIRGASGGRMAIGGNPSAFVERAASYGLRHEGFLNSGVAGRTDHIGLQVRNGSYVIPADVVSAAGQGNSLAGAKAFDSLLKQGPYGISGPGSIKASRPMTPSMRLGNTMRMPNNMGRTTQSSFGSQKSTGIPGITTGGSGSGGFMASGGEVNKKPRELIAPKDGNWKFSAGGVSHPGANHQIPILAAGGEYVVSPETVARIGNGDQEKGFRILDKLVLLTRRKHIETLRKLKPPKKK